MRYAKGHRGAAEVLVIDVPGDALIIRPLYPFAAKSCLLLLAQ